MYEFVPSSMSRHADRECSEVWDVIVVSLRRFFLWTMLRTSNFCSYLKLVSFFQQYCITDVRKSGPRREGWGSPEATEMVLNNLFYITAKVSKNYRRIVHSINLCACVYFYVLISLRSYSTCLRGLRY